MSESCVSRFRIRPSYLARLTALPRNSSRYVSTVIARHSCALRQSRAGRGRQGRHSVCRHLSLRHRKRCEPFAQDNARAVPADRNQTAAQPPPNACAPRPIAFVNGGRVAADAAIASGVETKEAHHLTKPILHHIVVVAAQGIARQSQRIGSERRLHIVGQRHRHHRARRRLYQPRVAAKGVVAKQIGHPSSPTLVQPKPYCHLPPVCNRSNGRHTAGYKTTLRRRLFPPVEQEGNRIGLHAFIQLGMRNEKLGMRNEKLGIVVSAARTF